jgi:hypothetical protein
MNALGRMATLGFILALSLGVGLVTLSAQATDPRIGTWKLNVAKSTFSPSPAPQSLTVKVEPAGEGEKASTNGMAADGTATMTTYTANFDGKDQPLTGSPIADTVSLKRIDARTTERTDKKDGKTVQTLNRLVSQDGKTMTVTVVGNSAQRQPVNSVLLFEKQ